MSHDEYIEPELAARIVARMKELNKRIRDDKNYWSQVETYLADHSSVQFSHGICPTCLERVMQEDPHLRPSK